MDEVQATCMPMFVLEAVRLRRQRLREGGGGEQDERNNKAPL